MTLFEVLTGGAFDRLNWQHGGEFDQIFSKKSNARGFAWGVGGGGWAVLELTNTLLLLYYYYYAWLHCKYLCMLLQYMISFFTGCPDKTTSFGSLG